jgi:hypothetical protein
LVNPTEMNQNLLATTKLMTVFEAYDTKNEAIASFS